ncbi:MAG: TrmB family transcriptional regulator [Chloroflexota bacterium]|nr:TrmB family transcriptional regulator [Chloroflexota bacterium]
MGFGEYEAKAYTTLIQRGPLTGYQLAKASGIPRPNVYPVIDRLEKRGAVTRIEVGDGVKYAALPAAEMLARLSRAVEAHLASAGSALGDLAQATTSEYSWNIEGYDNALARAEQLITGARERVLIGLWSRESARLAAAVAAAQARGVRIVTLCIEGCAEECGRCRGDVYRYAVAEEAATRWLIVVADDREILVGQTSRGGETQAAQTSLEVFVSMASQYLRDAIATAEIARSLGARLPKLLDREAADALQGGGLAAGGESWLKRMSAIVRRTPR